MKGSQLVYLKSFSSANRRFVLSDMSSLWEDNKGATEDSFLIPIRLLDVQQNPSSDVTRDVMSILRYHGDKSASISLWTYDGFQQ